MRPLGIGVLLVTLLTAHARAQVHYHDDGQPWAQRAGGGPDAVVPGWFYNLGPTGLRVRLLADAPCHLRVDYVFANTPAAGLLEPGDVITGAGGKAFTVPHQNGYGEAVFGPTGPILDFARALEQSQATKGSADELVVTRTRGGHSDDVTLRLPRQGSFAANYPADCPRSARIRDQLLDWLLTQQGEDGSWGGPPHDLFAPLALLARGKPADLAAVRKNAHFQADRTRAVDDSLSLINWYYTTAGIVLAEFQLATGEAWVRPELDEIRTFLLSSQYTNEKQIVRGTHDLPTATRTAIGGFGHNPGHEGYGPIQMLTGMGALAWALMRECGVDVDPARHRLAYDFLSRGMGKNGYVWYADEVASDDGWADLGRTGAASIAFRMSPFADSDHAERARRAAACIGAHPRSYPDTHGSPPMGMAFAALAAWHEPAAFRALMDDNRWWFTLAQCADGTFHYQPNRDNAGYGEDSRLSVSAVTAFVFALPLRTLRISGRPRKG